MFLNFIIQLLIQAALKYGLPWLKDWLTKKFPNIPWPVVEAAYLAAEKAQNKAKVEKKKYKECVGAACAMKPVQD